MRSSAGTLASRGAASMATVVDSVCGSIPLWYGLTYSTAGFRATMRGDVVNSSNCSQGRSRTRMALYEPGLPGISFTSIFASRSGYRAFDSWLGLGSALT